MSTPTLFSSSEHEMENEWYHLLKDLREVNEVANAEQDTRLCEAQQTEQAVQGPDSGLDESLEDQSLWGPPPPTPPPSSPSHSHGLALPIPVPPVVTGGIESQTTAPPAPLGPDMVVNNVPDESLAPELIGVPRPKQRRATAKRVPKQQGPKRVPNGVGKPPKRLSANQQQRQWDRERMAELRQQRDDRAAAEAAAMMASGTTATQPGQLYGQNQFCKNCGQSLSQTTSVFCPPAGPGGYYSQAAGPVYQQPPVPPAPFAAYAPSPAPAPASHLAPPPPSPPAPVLPLAPHLAPPPSSDPQIPTRFGVPGVMLQQQAIYYQLPNGHNMFQKRL
ncbi:hypothetical protein FVER53590_06695 [Fusarium verticillioides]|nr:hypothetical protein FVER53590_06695 [Fusarium verticillioides]